MKQARLNLLRALVALVGYCILSPAYAQFTRGSGIIEGIDDTNELPTQRFEPRKGKAVEPKFPDLPASGEGQELRLLPFKAPARPFRVFVDAKSLTRENETIVSYLVVLESDSGVKNYFQEAIDCDQDLVRVFAFGTEADKLVRAENSEWQPVAVQRGMRQYREVLMDNYICAAFGSAMTPAEIVGRLDAAAGPNFAETKE